MNCLLCIKLCSGIHYIDSIVVSKAGQWEPFLRDEMKNVVMMGISNMWQGPRYGPKCEFTALHLF